LNNVFYRPSDVGCQDLGGGIKIRKQRDDTFAKTQRKPALIEILCVLGGFARDISGYSEKVRGAHPTWNTNCRVGTAHR